jgi:polar amino acid transport system substrate-binding protein
MRVLKVVVLGVAAMLGLAGCVSGTTDSASADGSATGLPSVITASGSLRIGVSPDFPPMEYKAPDTQRTIGLDVELQDALGEVLGIRIERVESPFDQLINSSRTGRVDLVMSGLSDTRVRQETSDFVDYFMSRGRIYTLATKAGAFTKATDICGKTIAVSAKTDYYNQVKDLADRTCTTGLPSVNILPTDSGAAARLQIEQGRADLAAQGVENLIYINQKEQGKYQAVLDPLPASPFGIMVKKGGTQLTNAVLAAMRQLVASGRYQQILDKYGVGYGATKPVVNGG